MKELLYVMPMDRIKDVFTRAKEEHRACFISYVCAGDPDFETSVEICRTLIEAGVDILELGAPFSDPLADGLTNQLAAQRALENGMTSSRVFSLVEKIRTFSEAPIVLYTYYNLVFAHGLESYVKQAKAAGVDGLLTLDLPPEEAGDLLAASRQGGLKNIFIVAPTTPPERVARITSSASGFIYYVSREGVTGTRSELAANVGEGVAGIRRHTELPVVVGFGISSRDQVRHIADVADGVVVGSAIVNCIPECLPDVAGIVPRIRAKAEDLVAGLQQKKLGSA